MVTGPRQNADSLTEVPKEELIISVGDLFGAMRRRIWVILLTIVICVSAAVGYSLSQTPLYQASIKILVGQERGIAQDPSQTFNLQQLTLTLSEAVATRSVAEPVVQDLDLNISPQELLGSTSVEVIPDTQFIEVSYTSTDPERAQRIANAIGEEFSDQVSQISPDVGAITAIVWERAVEPQAPVSPNPVRNALIAFVLGGMLGVGIAFLLEYLDDSWRSAEEAEQVSGVPTFGVIPEFEGPKSKKK